MKIPTLVRAILPAVVGGISAASFAAVKVEEQSLVPKAANAFCTISPAGLHVAAVVPKGSRVVVVYDGVESQKFDTMLNFDGTPAPARSSGPPTLGGSILFSADGAHYAYAARQGDEYVVMLDGKEQARGPWEEPYIGLGPFAFSAAGNHFYFGISSRNTSDPKAGFRLQVDDKPGPVSRGMTTANSRSNDPVLFSPDGAHYAYIGQTTRDLPEGNWAVLDGRQVKYFGGDLQFATNARRLFSVLQIPGKWGTPPIPGAQVLLIDAKPVLKALYFNSQVWISPNGDHFAVAITPREGAPGFLTVDTKPVPGTEGAQIGGVYFSPDGKRLAVLCTPAGATTGRFMILDGKKQQKYQSIEAETGVFTFAPRFSADSSKFFYGATNNNVRYLVVNEEESDAGFSKGPYFAPGGTRVAYTLQNNSPDSELYLDNQSVFKGQIEDFSFSPDGAHYAFFGKQLLYLDATPVSTYGVGEWTGMVAAGISRGQLERYHYVFSPDGKHLVYLAGDPNNEARRGLWIDQSFVFHSPSNYMGSILRPTFTPDSRHLFWYDRVAPSVEEPQGHFQLYVDGEPSVKFAPPFYSYDRGNIQGATWEMGADGTLQFLVVADNSIKRVRVTPSPEKTIANLLASGSGATMSAPAVAGLPNAAGNSNKPDAGGWSTSSPAGTAAQHPAGADTASTSSVGAPSAPPARATPVASGKLGRFLQKIQTASNQAQQAGAAFDQTVKSLEQLGALAGNQTKPAKP